MADSVTDKRCPNPGCKAHQENWQFFDNEEFCSVCGSRLRLVGDPDIVPTNTVAAEAAARNEPYLDSTGQVRNTGNGPLTIALAAFAVLAIALFLWWLWPHIFPTTISITTNAASTNLTPVATPVNRLTATPVGGKLSDRPSTLPTNTPLPGPSATPVPPQPMATSLPVASSQWMGNIGMVASCTNTAHKTTYKPNEEVFVLIEAQFARDKIFEVHTTWQGPPGYNIVFNTSAASMSIAAGTLRDGGDYYVCFQATPNPPGPWTPGAYRANIFVNGNTVYPVASVDFDVAP